MLEQPPTILDITTNHLTLRESLVLTMLISNIKHVVTKEAITKKLSDENIVIGSNAIEVYVHRIRKKITNPAYIIRTVHGLGYSLNKSTE